MNIGLETRNPKPETFSYPKIVMSPKIQLFVRTIAVVVILAPVSLFAQKELNKSFTGIKKIRMNTSSGGCKIGKSSNASVTVGVKYSFDDDQFEPSIVQEGDRLVIREKFKGHSVSGDADWVLSVPDNTDIQFNTGSGNVESSNMALQLDAVTGSGDLVFTNITGEIKGTTGSGDVELDNFNGEIDATTGSGSMSVNKSSGEIKLNCGSGNIRITDSKATFRANTGSGKIAGRNITLDGSSSFNTGSGDAQVVLAATPQFDIGVNSGSGNAELNFNGNAIIGEIVMRASKRYGKITAPFEFDKTEELREGGDQVTVEKTAVKGNASHRISVSTGSGEAILKNN